MLTRFTAVLRRIAAFLRPPQERILADGEGFTLHAAGRPVQRVRWSEVGRVTAYKRDELSTDLICLDFYLPGRAVTCFVQEELTGYAEFMRVLEATIPLEKGWWRKVAFPAFAPNVTVIYDRSASSPDRS